MRIPSFVLACSFLASCGGGKKPAPVTPKPEPVETVEAEPEPAPPPPPPQMFHAKAALTPVKGAKMTATTVSFTQQEGEDTKVTAEIEGLKAGTYHLMIHENGDCGPNATKVGPAWAGGASAPLTLKVIKGAIGELEQTVALPVGGDAPIVGHTLVLHEDKKGKPGKTVACGTIDAAGADADAAAADAAATDE